MRSNHFLKAPQFSIRAILIFTALVALGLFAWRERLRYLHEHISVSVIDGATGVRLKRFQYRTSVITSETGESELWSEWQTQESPNALTFKIPKYCRFELSARALDLAGGYDEASVSTLVLPQSYGHTATLRLVEGRSLESFLVDSVTLEPIRNAKIVPATIDGFDDLPNTPGCFDDPFFDFIFATWTDSQGKFIVRNVNKNVAIVAPNHQRQVIQIKDASSEELANLQTNGIPLERAVKMVGWVTCKETGVPVPDCTVSQFQRYSFDEEDDLESIQMAAASELSRITRTDPSGQFELFIDGRMEDSRILIFKDGWIPDLVQPISQKVVVSLERLPLMLAGKVVDESGVPIKKFELTMDTDVFSREPRIIQSELGRFEIRARDRPSSYTVRAEGKANYSKHLGSIFQEDEEGDGINELVILTNGFSVTGTIVGSESHRNQVTLELSRLGKDSFNGWNGTEVRSSAQLTQAELDGSFRIDHVSDGTYKLVTTLFGHAINTRPVIVKSRDVIIGPIILPGTGSIRGKVRAADGGDLPFHRMYITHGQGFPVRWFYTDHRGAFEQDNVPAGWIGIGPKHEQLLGMCFVGWTVDNWMVVEPERTKEVSFENFPVFELHGLPHLDEHWGNVTVARQTAPVVENTYVKMQDIQVESAKLVQVLSHSKATEGEEFLLKMSDGHVSQEVPLFYHANRKNLPEEILFRSGEMGLQFADSKLSIQPNEPEPIFARLFADDPFTDAILLSDLESELYVGSTTIFLLKQGRVTSTLSTVGLHEKIRFQIEDQEPDEAMIHNTVSGWARIEKLRMSDGRSKTNTVQFNKGAELLGQLNLDGLPMMPRCIRLIDQRGVTFTAKMSPLFEFKFKNLWPGKWLLHAIGDDGYLRERVLAERYVELDGTDCHTIEF